MGAVRRAGSDLPRNRLRRGARMLLFLLLALMVLAPAALAVPGDVDPQDEVDNGAWLSGLRGTPIPHPSSGGVGTLNNSGVDSASANQVNDPSLDGVQTFPGAVPFVKANESETSVAAAGRNVVVGYNSGAGLTIADAAGDLSQQLFDGYSVSHDGGSTWHSGFIPAEPGGPPFTYGDPVVRVDRAGNFYYASLSWLGVLVSKSSDGGDTWTTTTASPTFFAPGFGPDKDWMAIGPDPQVPSQDDLYVTWTQFAGSKSQLWIARSTDAGATWSAPQHVYTPVSTLKMRAQVQFSNPVVDASSGRLYIPFLQFSRIDADDIRALVSDDGGHTFQPLTFNVSGAPDPQAFPNVTPGTYTDCGVYGGRQLTIHQGPATVGRGGLPRFVQATRIIDQPATAAANGRLFIAMGSSTSPTFGAGTGSDIRLLYSPDGGATWAAPVTVAASSASEPQHFHPAITVDSTGTTVRVVYYLQEASGRVRVDSAVGTVGAHGVSFGKASHVAAPFDLTPTNVTVSQNLNDPTFNYDTTANACYGLGEYLDVTRTGGGAVAAWAADRQLWKEPPGAIVGGVHNQEDVFFGALR